MKKTIRDLTLADKRVFIRADFNVPLDANGNITDDTRIQKNIADHTLCIGTGRRGDLGQSFRTTERRSTGEILAATRCRPPVAALGKTGANGARLHRRGYGSHGAPLTRRGNTAVGKFAVS